MAFFSRLKEKPLWVHVATALGIIIAFLLIFMLSLNFITHHGDAKTVPNLVGKPLSEVQSLLEKQGFDMVVQDSVYYDSLPATVIIKQVPEPDAVVKVNRTVYVTINRTIAPDVEMPNLLGYTLRNAQMVLENMGLHLGDTTYKPDFAKNSVLQQLYNGQTVAPGTKLKVGSKIALVLGSGIGNESLNVPTLYGMTLSEARSTIQSLGLILGVALPDPGISDTATAFVYKQSPAPRDGEGRPYRIRPGQMIDLWLGAQKPNVDSLTNAPKPHKENPPPDQTQDQQQKQ
jgi:beta-lactam-binding protein with PASTA domain